MLVINKSNINYKQSQFKCTDCGKTVSINKTKCRHCAHLQKNRKIPKKEYFCIDCGTSVRRKRIKRCKPCFIIYIKKHKKKQYCVECGREKYKDKSVLLCKKCAQKGNKHWNWQGGKSNCKDCNILLKNNKATRCKKCAGKIRRKLVIDNFCADCNKKIASDRRKCMSCTTKERFKNPKNHPRYKNGYTLEKHYCIKCGILLKCPKAKKCNKCANLGRKISKETKLKISLNQQGNKHWNWQGGKSCEPYPLGWNRKFKELIRERDSYICHICGKKQGKRKLAIHHIDYNKNNLNLDNLISLCTNCHTKTNFNRPYWIAFFT